MQANKTQVCRRQKLSKSSRLIKKKDFVFGRFRRIQIRSFVFIFTDRGKGRIGISLSKKILRSSVARNRIRRLIREAFRKNLERFKGWDLNVLGTEYLSKNWKSLDYFEVEKELLTLQEMALDGSTKKPKQTT